jgi:general stress protein 26
MAMWFLHDPASLTMISEARTQKVRNLRRDPRVCVVAEAGGGGADIRGVTVQGRADSSTTAPSAGRSSSASIRSIRG